MKQKLKTISKLLTLFLLIVLSSCQKDFDQEINPYQNKYDIKNYSFKQVNQIAKFKQANYEANQKFTQLRKLNKSTSREGDTDFSIDSTTIKEISVGDYTTYTMLVVREEPTIGYFENLVIEIDGTNQPKEYLMKYTPTQPTQYLEEHDSYTFTGSVEKSAYPTCIVCPGGDNEPDPNSGGSSWVTCTTIIMCNYLYVHVAGPNCGQKYPVTVCGTNFGGGAPPPEGNNNSNNPNNPNGGAGSSVITPTPVVTVPIIPIPPDEKKCALFNKLKIDQAFKNMINYMKANTGQIGEIGLALTEEPDGSYNPITGVPDPNLPNSIVYPIPTGTTIDMIAHTHDLNGLSIFSLEDLEQMYQTFMNHTNNINPNQTFSIVLVSGQSPNQEVYALTITDRNAFIAFYLANLGTQEKKDGSKSIFTSSLIDNAYPGFGINNNHPASDNEKNFLRFIGRNSGLKVHKADANLSQWNPLRLNSSGNVELEPACN